MCTVTVITLEHRAWSPRLRMVCNRDEVRTRPASLPPVVCEFGRRRAILPIDPQSGGTWIAANDAGIALTLLNVNPATADGPRAGTRSRGLIIPALLDCGTTGEVVERIGRGALRASEYPLFRVVGLDQSGSVQVVGDGAEVSVMRGSRTGEPMFFTSSGLGDDLVDSPRRELFRQFFAQREPSADLQDEFHAHQWPDRPHLSVRMERDNARTVSRTVIEIDADSISLAIAAIDTPDSPLRVTLPRRDGA